MIQKNDAPMNKKIYKTLIVDGHRMNIYDEGDQSEPALFMLHRTSENDDT